MSCHSKENDQTQWKLGQMKIELGAHIDAVVKTANMNCNRKVYSEEALRNAANPPYFYNEETKSLHLRGTITKASVEEVEGNKEIVRILEIEYDGVKYTP